MFPETTSFKATFKLGFKDSFWEKVFLHHLLLHVKNQAGSLPGDAKTWEMVKKYTVVKGSWSNSASNEKLYIYFLTFLRYFVFQMFKVKGSEPWKDTVFPIFPHRILSLVHKEIFCIKTFFPHFLQVCFTIDAIV